jgi:hypothetical protein
VTTYNEIMNFNKHENQHISIILIKNDQDRYIAHSVEI